MRRATLSSSPGDTSMTATTMKSIGETDLPPSGRDLDPSSGQFLTRVLAIPTIHDAVNLVCTGYHLTKIRFQRWNNLFEDFEKIVWQTVRVTTRYIVTPVLGCVGGWPAVDRWACHGLDKLESLAPIITKEPQEIKQIVLEKLRGMLYVVDLHCSVSELRYDPDEDYVAKIKEAMESDNETKISGSDTAGSSLSEEFQMMSKEDLEKLELNDSAPKDSQRPVTDPESLEDVSEIQELTKSENLSQGYQGSLEDSLSFRERVPWWKRVFKKPQQTVPSETSPGTNPQEENGGGKGSGGEDVQADKYLQVIDKEKVITDIKTMNENSDESPAQTSDTLKQTKIDSLADNNKSEDGTDGGKMKINNLIISGVSPPSDGIKGIPTKENSDKK